MTCLICIYLIDGRGPFPDPVSRFQPFGVHNPSMVLHMLSYLNEQVVDPRFAWTDWNPPSLHNPVIYELHVGTFTKKGTYVGVEEQLSYLKELGIDAIELMPLADFPGQRNWGYDGVCLYSPGN